MLPRRNITFPILPLLVSRTGNDCIPSPLQSGNSLELRGVVAISQTRGEISFPAAKNKISSHLPLPFLFFFLLNLAFCISGSAARASAPRANHKGDVAKSPLPRRREETVQKVASNHLESSVGNVPSIAEPTRRRRFNRCLRSVARCGIAPNRYTG